MARTIICFIFLLAYSLTGIAAPVLSITSGSAICACTETGETPGEENLEGLEGAEEEFCHRSNFPPTVQYDGSVDHKHPTSPEPSLWFMFDETHTPPPELI
jgi:hypothetical protein